MTWLSLKEPDRSITINCCPALLAALSALLTSGLSPFPAAGCVPGSEEALNFFDDFFVWG